MPLPRSQLPSFVNQSFLSPGEQQNYSYAQQLFYRYHPSVLQREMFDQLLADEKYKAADAAQKQEILERRLENLDSLLARYREAGVGPSGSAKLATSGISRGGLTGGAGNNLDFITDGTANEIKRAEAGLRGLGIVEDLMVEADRKPRQFGLFEADFVSKMDRLYGAGRSAPANLALELEQAFFENQRSLAGLQDTSTLYQRKKAATDLFYQLRRRFPSSFQSEAGRLSADGAEILAAIDNTYDTQGFLTSAAIAGIEPLTIVENERSEQRRAYLGQAGVGVQPFEERGREILGGLGLDQKDTDGDGRVSAAEEAAAKRKAMAMARKELGIAEPLTEEEALFLQRYTTALADDGKATVDEFASEEEFAKAKAAYDKGSRVENLPRGASPFYDTTYLQLLEERAGVRQKVEGIEGRVESPAQAAARRALQDISMPEVTQEALDAATMAGGPLAADALPGAMKRFVRVAGRVEPESSVEKFAQQLIDADAARYPAFQQFAQQVTKRYENDPIKRREALEYYGAYFHAQRMKQTSLKESDLTGRPPPVTAVTPRVEEEVGVTISEGAPAPKDIVPATPPAPAAQPLPVTQEPELTLTGYSLNPDLGAQVDPSNPSYAYKKVASGYLIFQNGTYTGKAPTGSRAFRSIEQVLAGGKPLPRGGGGGGLTLRGFSTDPSTGAELPPGTDDFELRGAVTPGSGVNGGAGDYEVVRDPVTGKLIRKPKRN